MRKFLTVLVILAVVIVGGGWYAKRALTDTISNQVIAVLNSPDIKQQVNQAIEKPSVQSLLRKYASNDTGGLTFNSQQDAVKFVINHMSPGEDVKLLRAYNNRDSLTSEQKQELGQEALSQFSPQELAEIAKTFEQGTGQ